MKRFARFSFIIFIHALIAFLSKSSFSQTVTDFDGNHYPTLKAGNYRWISENLRVTHDPEGNPLKFFKIENPYMDSSQYGLLYSWHTAMDSSDSPGGQGICPDGWHLPTDAEWDSLTEWAGGIEYAGAVLKRNGQNDFCALMAGNFNPVQTMHSFFGEQAYFWTSDSYSVHTGWMRHLGCTRKNINRSTVGKHYGFSVRCTRKAE